MLEPTNEFELVTCPFESTDYVCVTERVSDSEYDEFVTTCESYVNGETYENGYTSEPDPDYMYRRLYDTVVVLQEMEHLVEVLRDRLNEDAEPGTIRTNVSCPNAPEVEHALDIAYNLSDLY